MSTLPKTLRLWGRRADRMQRQEEEAAARTAAPAPVAASPAADVDIAPNDPIIAYFQSSPGAVDIDTLEIDSPGLRALKDAGVRLVVPLVTQGELIGLLNLGPRLSEQDYSGDDRKLLENLAAQAAPAVKVAFLVRQQQAEIRARERIEAELQVARLIQETMLPKETPNLPGWHLHAFYRSARFVGGDFYDYIPLPGGKLGIVVGDVTDKGVPAAMVMASTRSVLKSAAQSLHSPSEVLGRVNDLMVEEIPPKMFVTCLYAVLDPATGELRYANAGHNLPYVVTATGVIELRATGMPLGLMPGMAYEEKVARLDPGQIMLLYSDGLIEAHSTAGAMFGFPHLKELMAGASDGEALIDLLIGNLNAFTGPGWEQEDDITLVALRRAEGGISAGTSAFGDEQVLVEFSLPSKAGNERDAMERVAAAVQGLGLEPARMDRLKTAVAEATMNAMEHGNGYREDLPVDVAVLAGPSAIRVRITDEGGDRDIPEPETPDIDAKIAGLQKPRGWGLFLIKNMVDDMILTTDGRHHTVELVMHRKGAE